MFFLLSLALAHVPHDVVVSAAASVDVDPEKYMYLLLNPHRSTALYRSADGGRHWDAIGGEASSDLLKQLIVLDDGTLAALSDQRIWWSKDEGASWTYSELASQTNAIGGHEQLLMVTEDAILIQQTDGSFLSQPLSGAARGIKTTLQGTVLWGGGTSWTWDTRPSQLPKLPGVIETEVVGETHIWAGSQDGRVWWLDGTAWKGCAALPLQQGDKAHNAVRGLAEQNGKVFVMLGWKGPFVSSDGCASWTDASDLQPVYGGDGGATTDQQGYSTFLAGKELLVAGWMGIGTSEDDGASWFNSAVLGASYTRGLAYSPEWPDDPDLFVGSLGAGVVRATDNSVTPGKGFSQTNAQNVTTTDDPTVVYGVVGHLPWISTDGGENWQLITGFDSAEAIRAWTSDWLWMDATQNGKHLVVESKDQGKSWSALNPVVNGQGVRLRVDDQFCVATGDPAVLRCGEGDQWEERWTFSGVVDTGVYVDGKFYIADAEGIWTVVGTQATNDWPLPMDAIVEMEAAGTTIFAATLSAEVLVRDESGWRDTGVRLPSEITSMLVLPDYDQNPVLYLATLDGIFRMEDPEQNPSVQRWSAIEWIDDKAGWFSCTNCEQIGGIDGEHLIGVQQLKDSSSVINTSFRGESLRIWGVASGEAEVFVDGDDCGTIQQKALASKQVEDLMTLSTLGPGVHDLRIQSVKGGLMIDGIEGFPGTAPNVEEPDPNCGCKNGGEALLLLPLLGLGRRRYQRTVARSH